MVETPPNVIDTLQTAVTHERQREIAVEHLLFKTIEYVERHQPGLLDYLEASLGNLGDRAHDNTKDDDGVRAIARRMINSARPD